VLTEGGGHLRSLISPAIIVIALSMGHPGYQSQRSVLQTQTYDVAAKAAPALVIEQVAKMSAPKNTSAFHKRTFEGVTVSVPKSWHWIGVNDRESINTNLEALGDSLGLEINQGNNVVLLAGNAYDDARITRATIRLSVRAGATVSQSDLRGALSESQQVEQELLSAAEQTATAMRKLPQAAYYKVVSGGLRQNGHIICTWIRFEYDVGKGSTISDSWICPVSDRTFKLTASYTKARAPLYAATIDYTWRSLRCSQDGDSM